MTIYKENQSKILPNEATVSGRPVTKNSAFQLKDNRSKSVIQKKDFARKTAVAHTSIFQMKFKRTEMMDMEYTAETPKTDLVELAEFLHEDDHEYSDRKITVAEIVAVLAELAEKGDHVLRDYEIKDLVIEKHPKPSGSSTVSATTTSAAASSATIAHDSSGDDEAETEIPSVRKMNDKIGATAATAMHAGKQHGLPKWLEYVRSRANPDLVTDGKSKFYVRLDLVDAAMALEIFKSRMHIVECKGIYYGFIC